ncbi:hypothetical protein [Haloarcula litorea]|uniref:hypothetical protein n=1 Tax=Haloarcula litorea TaxID=3032579 RepID=UPI0023E8352B|nr:hypothetical protein [Halomicroarcula sp. GDY20]
MGLDLTDPSDMDWLARGRSADGIESRFSSRHAAETIDFESCESLLRAIEDELLEREPDRNRDEARDAAESILRSLSPETVQAAAENAWERVDRRHQDGSEFMPQFRSQWAENVVERYVECQNEPADRSATREPY